MSFQRLGTKTCFCSSDVDLSGPPKYGKYFEYSSSPQPSHADRAKAAKRAQVRALRTELKGSSSTHAANMGTKGAHEFYNMMWDPFVYRGNSYKSFQTAEAERCGRKQDDNLAKKRKWRNWEKNKIGGIVRPVVNETERAGWNDMGLQTEQFLEEATVETVMEDSGTQIEDSVQEVDFDDLLPKPFSVGKHCHCQTDPKLSCQFDENLAKIQKDLSSKILEQSLLETTEETELESLRKIKRESMQSRHDELLKIQKELEASSMVSEERDSIFAQYEHDAKSEEEAASRLSATTFASGSTGSIMSETFEILRNEGFMKGEKLEDVHGSVVSAAEAEEYLNSKIIFSRQLLDELISQTAQEREMEIAKRASSASAHSEHKSADKRPSTIKEEKEPTILVHELGQEPQGHESHSHSQDSIDIEDSPPLRTSKSQASMKSVPSLTNQSESGSTQ